MLPQVGSFEDVTFSELFESWKTYGPVDWDKLEHIEHRLRHGKYGARCVIETEGHDFWFLRKISSGYELQQRIGVTEDTYVHQVASELEDKELWTAAIPYETLRQPLSELDSVYKILGAATVDDECCIHATCYGGFSGFFATDQRTSAGWRRLNRKRLRKKARSNEASILQRKARTDPLHRDSASSSSSSII